MSNRQEGKYGVIHRGQQPTSPTLLKVSSIIWQPKRAISADCNYPIQSNSNKKYLWTRGHSVLPSSCTAHSASLNPTSLVWMYCCNCTSWELQSRLISKMPRREEADSFIFSLTTETLHHQTLLRIWLISSNQRGHPSSTSLSTTKPHSWYQLLAKWESCISSQPTNEKTNYLCGIKPIIIEPNII